MSKCSAIGCSLKEYCFRFTPNAKTTDQCYKNIAENFECSFIIKKCGKEYLINNGIINIKFDIEYPRIPIIKLWT